MNDPAPIVIGIAVILAIVLVVANSNKPRHVLSHWSHFFEFFSMSSNTFYTELEKVLVKHEMPNSTIKRPTLKEGGILSASREYLRIKHEDTIFDVCAAPFGKDFFISWWLYRLSGKESERTFYQIDEEDMFRSCVHNCILECIDELTKDKGTLHLTEAQKTFKMMDRK